MHKTEFRIASKYAYILPVTNTMLGKALTINGPPPNIGGGVTIHILALPYFSII